MILDINHEQANIDFHEALKLGATDVIFKLGQDEWLDPELKSYSERVFETFDKIYGVYYMVGMGATHDQVNTIERGLQVMTYLPDRIILDFEDRPGCDFTNNFSLATAKLQNLMALVETSVDCTMLETMVYLNRDFNERLLSMGFLESEWGGWLAVPGYKPGDVLKLGYFKPALIQTTDSGINFAGASGVDINLVV